ncbi:hypothetical protein BDN72DRAFT_855611 [Pluteus cervinus]|uniref:Uncharacterized protein n=1 Tax=Pluteus cervinus TaxID=181527 RepID=A0ACD3B2S1_9AGAR|nr:hypothetical protein BDN72DRAFT_855611 [Pluteus cervinus]
MIPLAYLLLLSAEFISYTDSCIDAPGSPSTTCGCSRATEDNIVKCFNCEISLDHALVQLGQNLVDTWIDQCNAAGADVPVATVSGGKSEATSVPHNNTSTSPSSQAPPIPTTTAPLPPTETGPSTGANPKGGSTGHGVMNTTPQTLVGIVLCAVTLSASSVFL